MSKTIIEICLPGEQRKTAVDVGDYRITVERLDGVACTEIEARAAMAMYAIQRSAGKRLNTKPRKTKTPEQLHEAAATAFFAP